MKKHSHTPENKTHQNSDACLLIAGELFVCDSTLSGTEISLYEGNELSQKFICETNRHFYFRLDYGKNYTVTVYKKDFETKQIAFNTNINGFTQKTRFYEFSVTINKLSHQVFHISHSAPNVIIKYSKTSETFEHEITSDRENKINHAA